MLRSDYNCALCNHRLELGLGKICLACKVHRTSADISVIGLQRAAEALRVPLYRRLMTEPRS